MKFIKILLYFTLKYCKMYNIKQLIHFVTFLRFCTHA